MYGNAFRSAKLAVVLAKEKIFNFALCSKCTQTDWNDRLAINSTRKMCSNASVIIKSRFLVLWKVVHFCHNRNPVCVFRRKNAPDLTAQYFSQHDMQIARSMLSHFFTKMIISHDDYNLMSWQKAVTVRWSKAREWIVGIEWLMERKILTHLWFAIFVDIDKSDIGWNYLANMRKYEIETLKSSDTRGRSRSPLRSPKLQ